MEGVKLKLVKENEIRKLAQPPSSISELQSILKSYFGSSEYHITYYNASGDLLTVNNDEELLGAYLSCKDQPSLRLVLREISGNAESILSKIDNLQESIAKKSIELLSFERVSPPKAIDLLSENISSQDLIDCEPIQQTQIYTSSSSTDFKPIDQNKEFIKKIVKKEVKKLLLKSKKCLSVHLNVRCNNCQQFPIVGIRYKCCQCPNYNLCADCEELYCHEHYFIKMRAPSHNPDPIENTQSFLDS